MSLQTSGWYFLSLDKRQVVNYSLKLIDMTDKKILMECIDITDVNALKGMQKKINQWMTTGHLVKFETVPTNNMMLFKIILNK
jgi:hypothetical protein